MKTKKTFFTLIAVFFVTPFMTSEDAFAWRQVVGKKYDRERYSSTPERRQQKPKKEEDRQVPPFTRNSCNPLDGMGCEQGMRCGFEPASQKLLGRNCSRHNDCGNDQFCANVGHRGHCVTRLSCMKPPTDSFPAVYDTHIKGEYDPQTCKAEITKAGNAEQLKKTIESHDKSVLQFFENFANAKKDSFGDYFQINEKGLALSKEYITNHERNDKNYANEIKKAEKMLQEVASSKDAVSSVPYYNAMARLYNIYAEKYKKSLDNAVVTHGKVEEFAKYIENPTPGGQIAPYDGFGNNYHPARVSGNFNPKANIFHYSLEQNICGKTQFEQNKKCVKNRQAVSKEGIVKKTNLFTHHYLLDPIYVESDGRSNWGRGKGIIPDMMETYGKESKRKKNEYDGVHTKGDTVKILREKVASITEFYQQSYNSFRQMATCVTEKGSQISGAFDQSSSKNAAILGQDGNGTQGINEEGIIGFDDNKNSGGTLDNNNGSISGAVAAAGANAQGADSLSSERGATASFNASSDGVNNALAQYKKVRHELMEKQNFWLRDITTNPRKQEALARFTELAQHHKLISKPTSRFDIGSTIRKDGYFNEVPDKDAPRDLAQRGHQTTPDNAQNSPTTIINVYGGGQFENSGLPSIGESHASFNRDQSRKSRQKSEQDDDDDVAVAESTEVDGTQKKVLSKRPTGWDEYDTAAMLDDISGNPYRYEPNENDSLFEKVTKAYMRNALPILFEKENTTFNNY